MPSQRLLLRPSCKSGSAYNVSLALNATFFAASVQPDILPNGTASTGSISHRRRTFSLRRQQCVSFSTTGVGKRDARATPDRKLGAGNLFANYEALTQTFGDPNAAARASANATGGDNVSRTVNASHPSQRKKQGRARVDNQTKEKSHVNPSAASGRNPQASHEAQTSTRNVRVLTWTPSERKALAAANIPLEEFVEHGKAPRRFTRDRGGNEALQNGVWRKFMSVCASRAWRLSQQVVNPADVEEHRASLNYRPWAINVPVPPADCSASIPWAVESSLRPSTGMALLDQEILNFAQYLELSPAEAAARQSVIATVVQTIETCGAPYHKLGIETQGSEETGLATPTSDIDFRIDWRENSRDSKPSRATLSPTLRFIYHCLREDARFSDTEFRAAKFPIITAVHKDTGIDIQIVAAPSTKPQQAVTAQYLAEIPHLRSVYSVLKTAFGVRGLVDVHSGGIGAYGLFMMLVASLKRKSSNPPVTPGEQFTRFLDFYSVLDMERYGVSVSPPKLFKKHPATDLHIKDQIDAARRRGDPVRAGQWAIGQTRLYQPYLFCLQDPANAVNDLGRKTNAIKHIQTTIRVMNNTLRRDMQEIFLGHLNEKPWKRESVLEPLVGRCHEIYLARRRKVEEYGVEVMLQKMREEREGKRDDASTVEVSEPATSDAQTAAIG